MCEPAKIYLVVTVIFIVLSVFNGISALTLLVKAAFAVIWTLFLNWLCSKGFSGLAWIIILMPFIFLFLAMFTTMDVVGVEGFRPDSLINYTFNYCTKCPINEQQKSVCNANNNTITDSFNCRSGQTDCVNVYNAGFYKNCTNKFIPLIAAAEDAAAKAAAAAKVAKVVATTNQDSFGCQVNGQYKKTITDAATCKTNGGKWSQSK